MTQATPTHQDDEPDVDELAEDVARIDGNMNGVFSQIAELKNTVAELKDENERLRGEVRTLNARVEGTDDRNVGSKKELAKILSVRGLLAEADANKGAGLQGALVDVPRLKTMAEGHGEAFSYSTIYDAWESLAREWDCLHYRDSTVGDKNKGILVDADDVPTELHDYAGQL